MRWTKEEVARRVLQLFEGEASLEGVYKIGEEIDVIITLRKPSLTRDDLVALARLARSLGFAFDFEIEPKGEGELILNAYFLEEEESI